MKKTAILLMLITVISKIFGFFRDIVLSYFLGTSNISDAYLISLTIPVVIFSFIGKGIETGYIPLYSRIENQSHKKAINFTNNLINILLLITMIIATVIFIFTESIVRIFAYGFDEETLNLAVKFTKVTILGIFFNVLIYIYRAFLEVKGNYLIPASIGFPLNFFIIASIIISTKLDIIYLAIGSLLAIGSQLALLIPFIRKKEYKYFLRINLKDKYIKKIGLISLPVILGVSVNQINILIDRTIASQIISGGISALHYANRLNNFIQGIFVLSVVTVMYPYLSKMAAINNISGLKKSLNDSIIAINLFVIPAMVGAMFFSHPIVQLLFGRGEFDEKSTYLTASALFFYAIGMVGFGLQEVLSRTFYSLQDTKTPMIIATLAVCLNIILNLVFSRIFGIGGLAFATSVAANFASLLMLVQLRKKIGNIGLKEIIITLFKIFLASNIMAVFSKIIFMYLKMHITSNIALLISVFFGVIVYSVIIYFSRINELNSIKFLIKIKLKGFLKK